MADSSETQRHPTSPSGTTDLVWHYTSLSSALKIIRSGTLFASRMGLLNDTQETQWPYEAGLDLLSRIGVPPADPLDLHDYNYRQDLQFLDPSSLEYRVKTSHFRHVQKLSAFITCFCADGDLLSQWKSYGKDGVALGFDPEQLSLVWKDLERPYSEKRTLYDLQPIKLKNVQYSIDDAAIELRDKYDAVIAPDMSSDVIQEIIEDIFYNYLPFFKNPAFAEEQEIRAVQIGLPIDAYGYADDPILSTLEFSLRGNKVITYVELPFYSEGEDYPENALAPLLDDGKYRWALRHIRLGPGVPVADFQQFVSAFGGLSNTIYLSPGHPPIPNGPWVTISHSEIPYAG